MKQQHAPKPKTPEISAVAAPAWHGQLGHLPKCCPSADCRLCGPPTLTAIQPPVAAIAATHITLDEGSAS